ncbi:MAG: LapA family protein [Bdellovibrionales bacterium]|nr:LapA family protein [Bdellovibrionales bacterium]
MRAIKNLSIFISALLILGVMGLFSVQNFESVTLQFMGWGTPKIPLAGAVISAFCMGFLCASCVFFINQLRLKSDRRKLKKQLIKMEQELVSLRNLPIDEEPFDQPIEEAQIVDGSDETSEKLSSSNY